MDKTVGHSGHLKERGRSTEEEAEVVVETAREDPMWLKVYHLSNAEFYVSEESIRSRLAFKS